MALAALARRSLIETAHRRVHNLELVIRRNLPGG